MSHHLVIPNRTEQNSTSFCAPKLLNLSVQMYHSSKPLIAPTVKSFLHVTDVIVCQSETGKIRRRVKTRILERKETHIETKCFSLCSHSYWLLPVQSFSKQSVLKTDGKSFLSQLAPHTLCLQPGCFLWEFPQIVQVCIQRQTSLPLSQMHREQLGNTWYLHFHHVLFTVTNRNWLQALLVPLDYLLILAIKRHSPCLPAWPFIVLETEKW